MSDFVLQKFSVRLDAAAADGTITADQLRLAKAALEGGGMDAALEALRGFDMAKAEVTPAEDGSAAPGPDSGPTDPRVEVAEDLADLRDELNRDLESQRAVELIQKIATAYAAMEFESDRDPE